MTVVKMICLSALALSFGKNQSCPIDIGEIGGGVEILEVVEEVGSGYREGPLVVGGENEWGTTLFVEIIVIVGRGVAGNAVPCTQDCIFGEEVA